MPEKTFCGLVNTVHCTLLYQVTKCQPFHKGPSINNVGNFSGFLTPPSSMSAVFKCDGLAPALLKIEIFLPSALRQNLDKQTNQFFSYSNNFNNVNKEFLPKSSTQKKFLPKNFSQKNPLKKFPKKSKKFPNNFSKNS
jgi:hypothetical protein